MIVKRTLVLAFLAAAGFLVYQVSPSVLQAQASTPTTPTSTTCSVPFEATVRQGPSTGTELDGTLNVVIDNTGAITGTVDLADDTQIPVFGQTIGRSINMGLDLSTAKTPGVYVFGVGTSLDPVQSATCGTALGGPFVGPAKGDSGDWLAGTPAAVVVTPEATAAS